MLTTIVLRDEELATLDRLEVLALEHLLHERLSEVARRRKSGDSALLLAIKAADYTAVLLEDLGDEGTADLLARVSASPLGQAAYERVAVVAELTARAA